MRSLEEVLKDLKDAEKEFKEKCELYGINVDNKKKEDESKKEEKISEN